MRRSQLFTKTSKTAPADETARNAQLLIQAGYVKKEMAGVYSYLPLGKKVLDKISQIIREEMNAIGGLEIEMSVLQNKELWQKTDRWDDKKVDNWFKSKLANGTEVGIGLTHEEPITESLHAFVSSYKDLPLYTYQIQRKFRNELRAKSGLMRGREFLMKDMYSFSRSEEEHREFYEKAAAAYMRVYERLGIGDITFRTFASGGIFSEFSDEFQTLTHVGEDTIYLDETKKLAVNKEVYQDEILAKIGLDKDQLQEKKAIEVGNIFDLGSKYADDLDLFYIGEDGEQHSIIMGCYGIGVSRLMGLLAEHFADERGLAWPTNVAPFTVYIARLGDDDAILSQADELYDRLTSDGFEVLYDDREARAGEKFADSDLLGIPYRIVVSAKTADAGRFELKARKSEESSQVDYDELVKTLDIKD